VRRRTDSSPFARAFFVLLEGLGILTQIGSEAFAAPARSGRETRVRVVTPSGSAPAGAG